MMQIGEVSEKLGMPASTIRYYEKVGLIEPPHRINGRRVFDENDTFTLRFVKLAQSTGFTIDEIRSLLDAYSKDPSPAGLWKILATTKQIQIRTQIESLNRMDAVLTEIQSCSCSTLSECVKTGLNNARN